LLLDFRPEIPFLSIFKGTHLLVGFFVQGGKRKREKKIAHNAR
jgi:hypothetical protein